MKKLRKVYWLAVRRVSRPGSRSWMIADCELTLNYARLRLLPNWVWIPVFRVGMTLNSYWIVHRVPFDVRFKLA